MKRATPFLGVLGILCLALSLWWPTEAQQGSVNAWIQDRTTGARATVSSVPPGGAGTGLYVHCITGCAGGGGGGTSSTFGAAFPATGTAAGFSDGTNMQGARVFDADTGGGTQYIAGIVLRKAASGGSVELGTSADPIRTDPTGTTTQPISAASLPLPTGAATEATLATLLTNATLTNRFPAGSTPADNESNAITASRLPVYNYVFDGSTWDRWTGAISGTVTANIGTTGGLFLDATYTGRMPAGASPADNESNTNTALSRIGAFSFIFDGSTWDRWTGAVTQATAANLNVRPDTSGATAAAPPARANYVGGLQSGATGGLLGGLTICDSHANVNVVTATTTLLITGVSGRHVRICSMNLVTAGANNVALISGTGATCGTGTTGMNGGTTAATGWNFSANGGLTQGSGIGEVNRTNATGDSVCVITSAAVQLSGRLSYAIH